MAWQRAQLPNFRGRALPGCFYLHQHDVHGTLRITRHVKVPADHQIDFSLELNPHGGGEPIQAGCHVAADNHDGDVIRPLQIGERRDARGPDVAGASSIGYGDIDLGYMQGMKVIFLVHRAFALTGQELGVALFVVVNIVNPRLDAICQQSGMRDASRASSRQGGCTLVRERSEQWAVHHGWR